MKQHALKITKGVDGWDAKVTIPVDRAETVAEAVSSGQFKNEAALVHAATAQRNVRLNRVMRDEMPATATVEERRIAANAFTYGEHAERAAGTGSAKVAKETVGKVSAAVSDASLGWTPAQLEALRAAGMSIPTPAAPASAPKAGGTSAGAKAKAPK